MADPRSPNLSSSSFLASLLAQVQHDGLREACQSDVATVEALVGLGARVFPNFDYE